MRMSRSVEDNGSSGSSRYAYSDSRTANDSLKRSRPPTYRASAEEFRRSTHPPSQFHHSHDQRLNHPANAQHRHSNVPGALGYDPSRHDFAMTASTSGARPTFRNRVTTDYILPRGRDERRTLNDARSDMGGHLAMATPPAQATLPQHHNRPQDTEEEDLKPIILRADTPIQLRGINTDSSRSLAGRSATLPPLRDVIGSITHAAAPSTSLAHPHSDRPSARPSLDHLQGESVSLVRRLQMSQTQPVAYRGQDPPRQSSVRDTPPSNSQRNFANRKRRDSDSQQ